MWNSRKDYMIWTLEWYVSASVTLMATGYACSLHRHSIIIAQPCWTYTLAHRNLLSPAGLVSPAGHTLAHPWTQALAQPCWTYPCPSLLDILLLTQALAQPCWTYHCSALAQPYTGPCSALLDTDRLSPA